jgi:hypothetical protein
VYTTGLRGLNGTPILRNGTVEENIELLNQVFAVEREILTQVNRDVTKVGTSGYIAVRRSRRILL